MKTLKDIKQALNDLPLSAFGDDKEYQQIIVTMRLQWSKWMESDVYNLRQAIEDEKAEERSKQDHSAAEQRAEEVKGWLKDGTIKQGTFLKMKGTRDGHGLREFIELAYGYAEPTLVCRQWIPASRHSLKYYDETKIRNEGYVQRAGVWMRPGVQLTTHSFGKVSKVLG